MSIEEIKEKQKAEVLSKNLITFAVALMLLKP